MLKQISFDDHVWYIKSWDNNVVGVVKLFCDKCIIDYGGNCGTTKKNK